MRHFKKLYFLTFVFAICLLNTKNSYSQSKIIDSLKTIAKKQKKKIKVQTYIEIAEHFTGINLDSAKSYSVKAHNLSTKIGDKVLTIITTHQLGNFARENSEYSKALKHFEESLKMSIKLNDSTLIANSYSGIGIVNSRLGDFRGAIKNFYESIPIYERLKDTTNIARGYLNLAVDLRKVKEFDNCILFNLKALKIFEKQNDLLNVAAINNNLAGVYNDNKNYEKAIKKAEEAKKYFFENNYIRYTAYPITNIAISYDSLNKPQKAETNYLKAIELHTKNREPYELAFLHNAYSNLNYKQKKYIKAINIGKKALEHAKEINALEFISSSSKTLAKSYAKIKDFQESNKFLMLHLNSKDSLFQKEKTKDIAELQLQYETSKKEIEIIQQKEQLLKQELIIKNRELYTIILGAALLILAILSFGYYHRYQFKKKQLQKEIDLKDALSTIKMQNRLQEQRLRISRDLHDNIGSQLTFIISSVDNLKYTTKDANTKLKEKLVGISTFTSETIHQLRDTIWAMNKNEITSDDVHTRILSFVEKAKTSTENIEFIVHYNIYKNTIFSSLEGMNIFRVIQEAINNALKHAEASKIEIKLYKKRGKLIVSIIDNGIGFDIKNVNLGNGLSNMEKRMSEIEGKVNINSEIKKGTEILVEVTLKNTSYDV
ncbi:tetratricopeptide repeat-containing sensor histidine kinase [Polaribacter atrinae]|uniref:tetratricopeptide repeat-containing sensor histidine kinase n=1 Tax=Polaribacter atrinae TaxID=1333662 RepID=UPI0024929695|nr:sensor histidine kinase [Polaribacter atrinae]